jgi:hypothetical protein
VDEFVDLSGVPGIVLGDEYEDRKGSSTAESAA